MKTFSSLKELLAVLSREQKLVIALFETGKNNSYKYDHALELVDYNEDKIRTLIDYSVIRENGVANDSKTINRRTFKGFLVNSYEPIETLLNGAPFIINPANGTFQFIYDFEEFIPAPDVIIIGVENSENFSRIQKQRYLFPNVKALFVSRYPQNQSKDLIKWLQTIPNPYWHFGDYDFAGINIYIQEYKRYLPDKTSFFIPENIEDLIPKYGNRKLYDKQQLNIFDSAEENIHSLIALLHKYKKGLEQESFLIGK